MTEQPIPVEGLHEIRDGMDVRWDVAIPMRDGAILRADIFAPTEPGRYPVIMTVGPYAKGLAFQDGFAGMWSRIESGYPEVLEGSSSQYQVWETVDPERWVPDGYICVRVDSRGAGRSPGYLDIWSAQENQDYFDAIEWAGTQDWSNGKVGLLGISYYAGNQWSVAALQPPHLAAIIPWEGYTDFYRHGSRQGGILTRFGATWADSQVFNVQHGATGGAAASRMTGMSVTGPEELTTEELAANRRDTMRIARQTEMLTDFYTERGADLTQIQVPLLSAANWSHHLHTHGNFLGWETASSEKKWLEVHGNEHYAEFYTNYGVDLQKRFFGHFLKGEDTGWDSQPPVRLNLRHVDGTFEARDEESWPLERTVWTRLQLDAERTALGEATPQSPGSVEFSADDPQGITFWGEPLTEALEVTGPVAVDLTVSSSTEDLDVFATVRLQDPDGAEVTFVTAIDPAGVVTVGCLRASHRELDEERSTPWRPWHTHTRKQPLTPGEPVQLSFDLLPLGIIIPAGYRIGVALTGRDFEMPGEGPWPSLYGIQIRGNGTFVHDDPVDRPAEVFAGRMTVYTGEGSESSILLPVVPTP